MGYKALGFVVWQGGKWYLRRRVKGASRKIAVAGVAASAAAVAVAVASQRAGSE